MNQVLEKLAGLSNNKALIIGVVVGALYYYMMYDDGSAIETQIVSVSQQLQEAQNKKKETEDALQEEARMKDTVGKLSEQFSFIAKKLPSELKSAEMIKTIDTVAKTSGVSVKLKKPGNVIKGEVVEELPVEVNIEGTYAQLTQFIYFISNQERLTRVMNFSIQSTEESLKDSKLKFDGNVVSFKLAPEPTVDATKMENKK